MNLVIESDKSMLYVREKVKKPGYDAQGPLYVGHSLPTNGAFEYIREEKDLTVFRDKEGLAICAIVTRVLKNQEQMNRVYNAIRDFKPKTDLGETCKKSALDMYGVFANDSPK